MEVVPYTIVSANTYLEPRDISGMAEMPETAENSQSFPFSNHVTGPRDDRRSRDPTRVQTENSLKSRAPAAPRLDGTD